MENAMCLLYDMCRLCLDVAGSHNIFETECLIRDIFICTDIIQISRDDKLPQTVCSNCMYKIHAAKDLRDYATKNDLYMRSLLHNENLDEHEVARPKISIRPMEEVVSLSSENGDRLSKTDMKKENKANNSIMQRESSPSILVTLVEEQLNSQNIRSRISVRSLEDINSGRPPSKGTSSKRDHTLPPQKEKRSKKISNEGKKSKEKNGSKCDTSPEKPPSSRKKERSKEIRVSLEDNKSREKIELKCDACNKFFETSKKLYLHQRSHSKTLHCPLDACGKRFATKGDLQKHIRAHTGERPYKCNLCDKSFTQNVTLKSHRIAVHEPKEEII